MSPEGSYPHPGNTTHKAWVTAAQQVLWGSGKYRYRPDLQMEPTRIELATPALQRQCSPN